MKVNPLVCAMLFAAMTPAVALADDPRDPAMRNAAARAQDREITRQLNRSQAASVHQRDARYAPGWRAARGADSYAERVQRHEREMAKWRRAVAACRAGDYSACEN